MESGALQDFCNKVYRLLGVSDPQIVISGLDSLANGGQAIVPEDIIEPLSGLGENISIPFDDAPYRAAMKDLLEWGLRQFPINPRSSGVHLWSKMTKFDDDSGYNQRLLRNPGTSTPIYFSREEPPIIMDNSVIPTIVTERSNVPIQRFNNEYFAAISSFLKQEVDARAVLATASLFGWEHLSTQCIILYVDGERSSKERLAKLFAKSEIPSIIIGCELRDIVSEMEEAQKLMSPSNMDYLNLSNRGYMLRSNQTPRVPVSVSPFRHGQSLSLKDDESKGSVGVFLSPTSVTEQSYALSASHVFPVTSPETTKEIITPGGLDTLSMLRSILDAERAELDPQQRGVEETLKLRLTRLQERCGTLFKNHIGSRKNGWRSDWALIRLDPEWQGVNGSWYNENAMVGAFEIAMGEKADSFSGEKGILNRRDPVAGDPCCKDGAATGSTPGTIGQSEARLFRKFTGDIADPEREKPENIEEYRFLVMNPVMSLGMNPWDLARICGLGDSGSAVFCADEKNNGWTWLGELTSLGNSEDGRIIGLVIPQSEVLGSIEDVTGMTWELSGPKTPE